MADELLALVLDIGGIVHAVLFGAGAVGRDRLLERLPGRVRDLAVLERDAPPRGTRHAPALYQRSAAGRHDHDVFVVHRAVAGDDVPLERALNTVILENAVLDGFIFMWFGRLIDSQIVHPKWLEATSKNDVRDVNLEKKLARFQTSTRAHSTLVAPRRNDEQKPNILDFN